ncbi:MAG: polysaccharide biosynthesis tyrosine autokinase [Bacteroidales bacterium]|nr:polysaccharide biosynthesis tyrosine autokinase [Bacteroidales bacterium]MCF8405334.1 polysaccharide biosynthesis tyrosine autokinase [Bacteroidales bacterium]
MKSSEEIFQQKTDIKEIIFKLLRYKYYFVFTALIALALAYFVNRIATRQYYNHSYLLIKEEQKTSFMNGEDLMKGFGLFQGIKNVENELTIIKSFPVVYEAIQEMGIEVDYITEEDLFPVSFIPFKSYEELYNFSPIHVIVDQTHIQPVSLRFYIDVINDTTYRLSAKGEKVWMYNYITNTLEDKLDTLMFTNIFKFGEKVTSNHYSFSVYLKENYNPADYVEKKLFFRFNDLVALSDAYQGAIGVGTTSATSSVVRVSLSGTNPQKITDFLNVLTRVYLEQNLEKKNTIAFNTVKFIDSRISDIADSLMYAENKLQNFRTARQVMNLSFQGQKLYEKMNALESERALILVKQRYYDYIQNYFERNQDVSDLVAPSSMEVQDPVLNELIRQLLDLNNERMNYMQQNNPKNLFLRDLEIQISNMKNTITENISYNAKTTEISLQDIDSRMNKLNSQISSLPRTERELIGMERQFKLNDAIYTFLLQKRAEAQIAQASNTSDYEVIEESKLFRATVVSPKKMLNYIIALFLGLFLPFIFIVTRDFLNNKITDSKDIEAITNLPIIGQVFHNKFKTNAVIQDYPKSPIADSFRGIRTNLKFFAEGNDKMVILLTSSQSGEGKSFCSINLASVYALLGKKTVLLGFDLRRPALFKDLQLNNEKGITSYLIKSAGLEDVIQPTKIKNLHLIAAGPIPPNPVELIASKRTAELFEELKKQYDYIIIDSSPIGAVTDSFLLFNYADINVFTIRHNLSSKDAVKSNLKNIEMKQIPNVSVLINDVKIRKNSYGYAYQSNYYNNDSNSGFFRRLFSLNKD